MTQGDAIAVFVSNEALKGGKDEFVQAKVLEFLSWASTDLVPAIFGWLFPSLSMIQYNKDVRSNPIFTHFKAGRYKVCKYDVIYSYTLQQVAKSKAESERLLHGLDNHLLIHTYLVGESITLADIAVFTTLLDTFKYLLDPESRKLFVNVSRWFDTILNQTKVKGAMEQLKFEFSYCVTPAKFDGAKFKEITGSKHFTPYH